MFQRGGVEDHLWTVPVEQRVDSLDVPDVTQHHGFVVGDRLAVDGQLDGP